MRNLFLKHIGQTSPTPPMVEIESANEIYITDIDGKEYIDLTSGFSVTNIGHRHPKVIAAVKGQLDKYLHTTVYGEHIQSPQVQYAQSLFEYLPSTLNSIYYVNSGSEAIEGAMKLAKRTTGRAAFLSARDAYHGSTQGAMSLKSDEYYTQRYRPLLPNMYFEEFNSQSFLDAITDELAGVVIEVVQAEAGVNPADEHWIKEVRSRCDKYQVKLIFDEIQTGFGRTGSLFAFQKYEVVPDILCIAKGMGGGMPCGAFVSDVSMMNQLSNNPILGHITTFGGHPVSVVACQATLDILTSESWIEEIEQKSNRIVREVRKHSIVTDVKAVGFLINVRVKEGIDVRELFQISQRKGIITDGFLFDSHGYRIAPPLCATDEEVDIIIDKVLGIFDDVV